MRDVEEQIAEWRQRMAAGGVKTPAVLDELESHLREEFQARISAGNSEEVAFQTAAARIGSPSSMRTEFNKISGTVSLPVLITGALWIGAVIMTLVAFSSRIASGKVGPLLFTHILAIVSGYVAALSTGALAICYVYSRWAGRLTPAQQQALNRAAVRFAYISAVLSVAGFLLGMLWAHKYRGAAWLNDPREFGGVFVCVWFVALSLVKLSDHARMILSIIGNLIVAEAWFGALYLVRNPAMHWYGVVNYLPLQLFVGVHLLFLLMAFSRKLETAET
jgi:hypothetical protein